MLLPLISNGLPLVPPVVPSIGSQPISSRAVQAMADFGTDLNFVDDIPLNDSLASGLLNLAAQAAGQGVELRGGQFLHLAFGQRGLDLAELFAPSLDAVLNGSQPLVGQGFQFDGFEVLYGELVFAAPSDERGLGGVEFGHEARVGPATGAQFNEALDGFLVVHSVLSRRSAFSQTSFCLSAAQRRTIPMFCSQPAALARTGLTPSPKERPQR